MNPTRASLVLLTSAVSVLAACADPQRVPRAPTRGETEETSPLRSAKDEELGPLSVGSVQGDRSYSVYDARGPITENEFVRRFERVTGSGELAGYERNRHAKAIVGFSVVGALGVGLLVVGTFDLQGKQGCSLVWGGNGPGCDTGLELEVFGGLAMTVGLIGLSVASARDPDGDARDDHFLSAAAARTFVDRYNRALQRGAGDVRTVPTSSLTVSAWIGPGLAGLRGEF
jgi:hypothetical protein